MAVLWGLFGMQGLEPWLFIFKESVLPTVLFLHPLYYFSLGLMFLIFKEILGKVNSVNE